MVGRGEDLEGIVADVGGMFVGVGEIGVGVCGGGCDAGRIAVSVGGSGVGAGWQLTDTRIKPIRNKMVFFIIFCCMNWL
jgi:hypothetical protein